MNLKKYLTSNQFLFVFLILNLCCNITYANEILTSETLVSETPLFFNKIEKIEHIEFLLSQETQPPLSHQWQAITLPDIWSKERYQISDNGWYQLRLNFSKLPEKPLAILLPKINMNAAIYINGQLLGDGGSFEEPLSRNWSKPLHFTIPAQILKNGENFIHIRLKSYSSYGQMSVVYLGPNNLINTTYNKLYFVQVTITAVMLMGLFVLALLVFSFWLRRRQRSQYFWFLINIIAWSVLPLNMLITNIPFDVKIWEWFCHSSVALWVIAFTIFVHHFIEKPLPILHKILIVYFITQSLLIAVTPLHELEPILTIIYSLNLLIGIYAILRLLISLMTQEHRGTTPLAICSIILLALSAHDWAVQTGLYVSNNDYPIYLNYLIMPIFFLFIGWYLMDEFVRSLNKVEELNKNLEDTINTIKNELEEKYKTIQEIKTEKSIYEERQRLSREIHDGVSGSLTNSLMLVDIISEKSKEDDELKNRLNQLKGWLRNSLSDIRNLIFSLDSQDLTGLEIFHYISDKYRDILSELDIQLKVTINQQSVFSLSQTESLNLLKVLQEAMNNIIRHSNASLAHFSVKECENFIIFELQDNGKGFEVKEVSGSHHGIENMSNRCAEINASLEIRSHRNEGCYIQVSLKR